MTVGFVGVIITLLCNAWQARKQQERQWECERKGADERDAHERTAIRSALTAELCAIRGPILVFLERAEKRKKRGIPIPLSTDVQLGTEIYRAILLRIIMPSPMETITLGSAYEDFIEHVGSSISIEWNDNIDIYISSMKRVSMNIELAIKILAQHQEEQDSAFGTVPTTTVSSYSQPPTVSK